MTKKHFDALAAALKSSHPYKDHATYDAQKNTWLWKVNEDTWLWTVNEVADVCARFNPNFDRARFLAACGVEG